MTGAEPVTDRRGGDSRARRNAAEMNRQSLKRQTPPTCHCEGASCPWQSREGTCSPYRPPSKRHAPIASVAALTAQPLAALPPYGCGVPLAGSERHAGWRYLWYKFSGARQTGLSLRGRFAPVAISQYPVGSWGSYRRNRSCLPEIATAPSGPRNDKSGYLKPWNPCQRNRNCLWRSLSAATFSLARWAYAGNAATDAIGLYVLSLPL